MNWQFSLELRVCVCDSMLTARINVEWTVLDRGESGVNLAGIGGPHLWQLVGIVRLCEARECEDVAVLRVARHVDSAADLRAVPHPEGILDVPLHSEQCARVKIDLGGGDRHLGAISARSRRDLGAISPLPDGRRGARGRVCRGSNCPTGVSCSQSAAAPRLRRSMAPSPPPPSPTAPARREPNVPHT